MLSPWAHQGYDCAVADVGWALTTATARIPNVIGPNPGLVLSLRKDMAA